MKAEVWKMLNRMVVEMIYRFLEHPMRELKQIYKI